MRVELQPSTLDQGGFRYNWSKIVRRFPLLEQLPVQACRLCGQQTERAEICTDCRTDLPWRTAPWRRRLSHVDEVRASFDFVYPIRQLLHRMKYGKELACARLLGELAAVGLPDFEQLPPDAVLFPVPVSRGRAIVRGFNQAMELALPLGRIKSLEIDGESIYKRRADHRSNRVGDGRRPQSSGRETGSRLDDSGRVTISGIEVSNG